MSTIARKVAATAQPPTVDTLRNPTRLYRNAGVSDPLLPALTYLVLDLDPRSLDGSDNSSIADGGTISAAVNYGTGSDFAQSNASYRPTLGKGAGPNGVDVIVNAAGKALLATNSDSECAFLQNTMEFEVCMVLYKDAAAACWPMGNTTGTSDQGIATYWYADDRGYISAVGGGATLGAETSANPILFPETSWVTMCFKSEGVPGSMRVSNDRQNYSTGANNSGTAAGNMLREIGIGGINNGGAPFSALTGKIARVLVWSKVLDSAEQIELNTHLSEVYGL